LRAAPSEADIAELQRLWRPEPGVRGLNLLRGTWRVQVPRLGGRSRWTGDFAGLLLDLYTSSAGKFLGMELPSAPLVSISGDGRVKTRVWLSWGSSRDEVALEGSLRELGPDELELEPMAARSSVLKNAPLPLQPARRLRIAYADEELLVLKDRHGAVDMLWREEGEDSQVDKPSSVAQDNGQVAMATGLPTIDSAGSAEEEGQRDFDEEQVDAPLEGPEAHEAQTQMEESVGKALQAIDAKLQVIDEWDPLAEAKRRLQQFEEHAEAKLRGLDEQWERYLDQKAEVEELRQLAQEADAKLAALRELDGRAEERERALEAAAMKAVEGIKAAATTAEAGVKAAAMKAEAGIKARWERRGTDLEREFSARLQQRGGHFEQGLFARLEHKAADAEQEALSKQKAAAERAEMDAMARLKERGAHFEQGVLSRLERRGAELEQSLLARLEQQGAELERSALARTETQGSEFAQRLIAELRAESRSLEEALGKEFEALSNKIKELQDSAPERSSSRRDELRAEAEALRSTVRKRARAIWPWK